MKNKFGIIIGLLIIASSCATQKRCAEKWPPEIPPPDTIRKVITKDTTIYRDTTITVTIPGEDRIDTLWLKPDPVTGHIQDDSSRLETRLAISIAKIETGKLIHNLTQKDTTITTRLDSALVNAEHWRQEYLQIKEKQIHTTFKPGLYHRITSTGFWVLLGFLILVFLAMRYRR